MQVLIGQVRYKGFLKENSHTLGLHMSAHMCINIHSYFSTQKQQCTYQTKVGERAREREREREKCSRSCTSHVSEVVVAGVRHEGGGFSLRRRFGTQTWGALGSRTSRRPLAKTSFAETERDRVAGCSLSGVLFHLQVNNCGRLGP